jgi:hypothetical protein
VAESTPALGHGRARPDTNGTAWRSAPTPMPTSTAANPAWYRSEFWGSGARPGSLARISGGTTTEVNVTVPESVARWPSASQSRWIVMPGVPAGTSDRRNPRNGLSAPATGSNAHTATRSASAAPVV